MGGGGVGWGGGVRVVRGGEEVGRVRWGGRRGEGGGGGGGGGARGGGG